MIYPMSLTTWWPPREPGVRPKARGARLLALQDQEGQWGRPQLPASREGLPDVGTRRLLRDLHRISPEQLAEFLKVDSVTVSNWEKDQDPTDDRIDKYRTALDWIRSSLGTYNPAWTSTTFTLLLLRDMGLDPASDQAHRAVGLVRNNSKWDHDGEDYFDGEVEPCINGEAVALGAYFGQNVDGIVERLLGEQLADGGWNCEAERGSTRSSSTPRLRCSMACWSTSEPTEPPAPLPLPASEVRNTFSATDAPPSVNRRDHPDWARFSFPTRYHYDVLRGLDYLRNAGVDADERCAEAIDLVENKRDSDGRWPLENTHPGRVRFDMEEGDGKPSRWITLRALRVLTWAGR